MKLGLADIVSTHVGQSGNCLFLTFRQAILGENIATFCRMKAPTVSNNLFLDSIIDCRQSGQLFSIFDFTRSSLQPEIYTIQRFETAIEHRYLPPL